MRPKVKAVNAGKAVNKPADAGRDLGVTARRDGHIDTTTPVVAYRYYEEDGELKCEPIWADELFKQNRPNMISQRAESTA